MEKELNKNNMDRSCNLRIHRHPSPVAPPRSFKVINKIAVNSLFVNCQGIDNSTHENKDENLVAPEGCFGHPKVSLRLSASNYNDNSLSVSCPYCGTQYIFEKNNFNLKSL